MYFERKVNNLKARSTDWWRSIKVIEGKTTANIPSPYLIDDQLCGPQEFVNKLNTYYSNIAKPDKERQLRDNNTPPYTITAMSIGQIKKHLLSLQCAKSVIVKNIPLG